MDGSPLELEKKIEALMFIRGEELDAAIENLRKESIFGQVNVLKSKLPDEGRCPICTLKLPCRHFLKPEEARHLHISTPKAEIHSSTPKSQKSSHLSLTPDMHSFKVRYRGKQAETPSHHRISDELERLKRMEELEKYKEEKLQREIQHIEEIKRMEKLEKERSREFERKRQQYYEKQREKLQWYKEDLRTRIEMMERKKNNSEIQERIHMQQQKKALEEKRRRVFEYKLKKQMLENLVDSHIVHVNTPSVSRKKTKFKSLKDIKAPKIF